MPGYKERCGSKRGIGYEHPFDRLSIRMQHHVRRGRDAPQHIDFIVIMRSWNDARMVPCQGLVPMQVHQTRGGRVVEVFRVNVVKRRLQESPQEREHTQYDTTETHGLMTKLPPLHRG
jgi:hypothetical protein